MRLDYFIPEIVVFVGACLLLLASVIRMPRKNWVLGVFSFVIITTALVVLGKDVGLMAGSNPAGSLIIQDNVAAFCRVLLLLIAYPVLLSSMDMFSVESKRQGEFLFLLLLSIGGLMVMVQTSNLLVLYLTIECASIPLYMLAGLKTGDIRPKEAVVKYFLLGAFASAITIYGISLIFSVTKSFDFISIAKVNVETIGSLGLINAYTIGFLLVIAGLSFKVAAVPFHFWAPDVYEGAPPVSTAFISVAPKIGALVALSRFAGFAVPAYPLFRDLLSYILMGISVASMTYGNITALLQTEVKRIMAYSSIAQIGYMLISVVVIFADPAVKDKAIYGVLMYVTAYALMNIAVFSIIKVVEKERGGTTLDHFKGLSKTHPALALCMTIALVSLLGIPFTAGFFGKLWVFSSAISARIYWIVIAAVLNSALSAFYYFNIAKAMYIENGDTDKLSMTYLSNPATISAFICTAGTLIIGLLPAIYSALSVAASGFGS